MIITRGKYRGKEAKLHQAANDWVSIDVTLQLADGLIEILPLILNPTSAEYTQEDIDWLMKHAAGSFWREYEGVRVDDGPIKLRKTPRPHQRPV